MAIFAVVFFEEAHDEVVQRLYDEYPDVCQLNKMTYLVQSREITHKIAEKLGLVEKSPTYIQDADGGVFRLTQHRAGRGPKSIVEWLKQAEENDE